VEEERIKVVKDSRKGFFNPGRLGYDEVAEARVLGAGRRGRDTGGELMKGGASEPLNQLGP